MISEYIATTENIEGVYAQYEAIRKSGMTNMFDKDGVLQIAEGLGYTELADQIDNGDYIKVLKNYGEAVERGYISP